MPLGVRLYLLPLTLTCLSLCAEEPVAPKPEVAKSEASKPQSAGKHEDCEKVHYGCPWKHNFGATVQVSGPLRDLKTQMDGRIGYGLGVQWIHDSGDWHASRTRMEYNVFAEGPAVGPLSVKTYSKNYLLGWDHLFKLNPGPSHAYLVAGIGGVRWVQDQNSTLGHASFQTTKLQVTGGVGVRIAENVNLEARYVFSGIQKTFDANVVQASLGWRF
jgi:opacity protein-like surface antigen